MIRSLLVFLALTGTAAAQQPIRTGIDATFAPHAMPKPGGGLEGFNIDDEEDWDRALALIASGAATLPPVDRAPFRPT